MALLETVELVNFIVAVDTCTGMDVVFKMFYSSTWTDYKVDNLIKPSVLSGSLVMHPLSLVTQVRF